MIFLEGIWEFGRFIALIVVAVAAMTVIAGAGMYAHVELAVATKHGLASIGLSSFEKPVIGLEALVITVITVFLFLKSIRLILEKLMPDMSSEEPELTASD